VKLVPKPTVVEHGEAEDLAGDLAVGQWYWVTTENYKHEVEEWLGCIVYLGSNYAKLEGRDHQTRIHFDEFFTYCKRCFDYEDVIQNEITGCREELGKLLSEVQRVLGSVGIKYEPGAEESQALVALNQAINLKKHKAALVKAKDEHLPGLFDQIGKVHEQLASWMTVKLIPHKAQAKTMKGHIDGINNQIFAVELYAGLVEDVHHITKGKPAPIGTKLHLMQRMHYMDEECLLNYEAGGMRFESISQFDKWLKRKINRDRLLPHPRCLLAFRVRRFTDRHMLKMISLWQEDPDVKTFLYVRNGTNLYRINTGVEFSKKLFPDERHQTLGKEKLWATHHFGFTIITDRRLKEMRADYLKKHKKWRKLPKRERQRRPFDRPEDKSQDYFEYNTDSVYYDDITAKLRKDVDEHNRIVLILQGLFDRTAILHPHPPVKLWNAASFDENIELVYDQSRALKPPTKPDFEAYRAKLNASICKGCVTVGQQDAWRRWEYDKLSWRYREAEGRFEWYRGPYGNPGPGKLARVTAVSRDKAKVSYRWKRERRNWRWDAPETKVTARFTTEATHVLNVDAYTPGDYKQFFEDPRTRAQYLKWAPLLLAAEDYHAGKAKVGNDGQT